MALLFVKNAIKISIKKIKVFKFFILGGIMKGWIKLWRKVLESNMYKCLTAEQRDVMIQCLLLANCKEEEWKWGAKLYKCKPGQFITSLSSLKERAANNVTKQNIRTALSKLEKWGFLTNQATKAGRLITICNWEFYQKTENKTNKDTNKELTKKQQRYNKLPTNILTPNKKVKKKVKRYKKVKKYVCMGEDKKVKLTQEQYKKLIDRLGKNITEDYISRLNDYICQKGKRYKSHYHTILNWTRRDGIYGKNKQNSKSKYEGIEEEV